MTKKLYKSPQEALEKAIVYLLTNNGADSHNNINSPRVFLAQVLLQMERHFVNDLPARAAMNIKNGAGHIYINPDQWVEGSIKYNADTLAHEVLHMIMNHIPRSMDLDTSIDEKTSFNSTALNIAMDCSINQLCGIQESMAKNGHITLKNFAEMIGVKESDLEAEREFEYYFGKMKDQSDHLKNKYGDNLEGIPQDELDDHGKWKEGDSNKELSKDIVKDMVRKAKEKNKGNVPADLQQAIEKLFESKVNWKQKLANFCRATINANKKKTRAKRNRRYGIIEQGRKKDYVAHIGIGLDTSGSMSTEDLQECWAQMHKISKTMNVKMTVIECDTDCQAVYEFDPNKEFEVKGRGGTLYQPVLDKAAELKVDGLVFMGDMGAFDKPEKPKYPLMWAVIGKYHCEPPADFGKIVNVWAENA